MQGVAQVGGQLIMPDHGIGQREQRRLGWVRASTRYEIDD